MPDTLQASAVDAGELEQVANLAAALPQGSAFGVVLQHLVVSVSKGKDVAFVETEKHLSPNQAAALLHMSRPHLLKFIRSGELKTAATGDVGTHHRIPMSELMDFIDRRERAKAAVASAYGTPDVVEKALRDGAAELTDEDVETLNAL